MNKGKREKHSPLKRTLVVLIALAYFAGCYWFLTHEITLKKSVENDKKVESTHGK